MKRIDLTVTEPTLTVVKPQADRLAGEHFTEPVLLSWFDRVNNRVSPADALMCHGGEDISQYARNHGGGLDVSVNGGALRFFYTEGRDFAEVTRATTRLQAEDVPQYFA